MRILIGWRNVMRFSGTILLIWLWKISEIEKIFKYFANIKISRRRETGLKSILSVCLIDRFLVYFGSGEVSNIYE